MDHKRGESSFRNSPDPSLCVCDESRKDRELVVTRGDLAAVFLPRVLFRSEPVVRALALLHRERVLADHLLAYLLDGFGRL